MLRRANRGPRVLPVRTAALRRPKGNQPGPWTGPWPRQLAKRVVGPPAGLDEGNCDGRTCGAAGPRKAAIESSPAPAQGPRLSPSGRAELLLAAPLHVEAYAIRIGPLDRVDLTPRSRPFRNRSLDVVDPVDRRDPSQPLECTVVAGEPAGLILTLRPDQREGPRVTELHHEGAQHLRARSDVHPREFTPVRLRLRTRRRLHSAVCPNRRLPKARPHVAQHRFVRAPVSMHLDQVVVQVPGVDRTASAGLPSRPGLDDLGVLQSCMRLPFPAVHRPRSPPALVVPGGWMLGG